MRDIILTLEKIDSMCELTERLRQSKSKTVVLGQNARQRKEFIMILVKNIHTGAELLKIGVICEGHGLKPQYEIDESCKIIIGFNNA